MRTKRRSQQKDAAPGVAPVITVNWFNVDVSGESGEVEVAGVEDRRRSSAPSLVFVRSGALSGLSISGSAYRMEGSYAESEAAPDSNAQGGGASFDWSADGKASCLARLSVRAGDRGHAARGPRLPGDLGSQLECRVTCSPASSSASGSLHPSLDRRCRERARPKTFLFGEAFGSGWRPRSRRSEASTAGGLPILNSHFPFKLLTLGC